MPTWTPSTVPRLPAYYSPYPWRPARSSSVPPSDPRTRKTRSLRETISKKVGTFLEAQKDRQKEEEQKHLSEPVLRPLLTAAISQRESFTISDEPQEQETDPAVVDNLMRLIKNAVTYPIHRTSLLSLRTEAAADTLQLMQQVRATIINLRSIKLFISFRTDAR